MSQAFRKSKVLGPNHWFRHYQQPLIHRGSAAAVYRRQPGWNLEKTSEKKEKNSSTSFCSPRISRKRHEDTFNSSYFVSNTDFANPHKNTYPKFPKLFTKSIKSLIT